MLWSLHNRASEAARPDARLIDPESLRIHAALRYDFVGHFGTPRGSLAVRAARIDAVLRRWLERHPDGQVVSLGEGLETQSRRVDNQRLHWLSVDLPDAIRLRERFLAPTSRFGHLGASALDPTWMDAVDPAADVFIVAQGLLMYLPPQRVRALFRDIADRFPGAEMVFDAIPPWFSSLTLRGLRQTPRYRLPPMPWGISRDQIAPTLRQWHSGIGDVALLDYAPPRGMPRLLGEFVGHTPFLRQEVPSLAHLTITRPPRLSRRSPMPPCAETAPPETLQGVMTAAVRTAGQGHDLAMTAAQVIARRVALGVAASVNPLRADHQEFARMVPEKLAACSAAGTALLQWSGRTQLQAARSAREDLAAQAQAARAIARSATPAALAAAQASYASACCGRMVARGVAIGMAMLGAQDAVMAPFRSTVAVNLQRLAG
jgi:hypothetical protein